jgi:hypothetical protein
MIQKINRLRLLRGKPILVPQIGYLHPLTLNEIDSLTEEIYNLYLLILTQEPDIEGIETYDMIIDLCFEDKKNAMTVCLALSSFFKENIAYIPNNEDKYSSYFYLDIKNNENKYIINKRNYEQIKFILKAQNCIEEKKNKKYKTESEKRKAEEIEIKIRKAKEKINKAKMMNNENLELVDLISVFSSISESYNLLNVWDLTIYQFQNQFQRLQMIESYDIGIRQLLAGAKKEEVNLEYYLKRIN